MDFTNWQEKARTSETRRDSAAADSVDPGMPVVRFEFYKDLGRERLGRGKPLFRERRGFLDGNNSETISSYR
jgi:hypothetical protein